MTYPEDAPVFRNTYDGELVGKDAIVVVIEVDTNPFNGQQIPVGFCAVHVLNGMTPHCNMYRDYSISGLQWKHLEPLTGAAFAMKRDFGGAA